MNKQKILQYITVFIIIAFVGEIFIIGFGGAGDDAATATPTPAVSMRTFAGSGDAAIRVTKLTSQFLAECNTTDETILDRVKNTAGVESAIYETSGILFSTLPAFENDTAIVTTSVASVLEDSCEGFMLYRFAYVLPQGSVNVTGIQKAGNVTLNSSIMLTNYSLLSYSQLVSSPGVQAFLDYRYNENSTPTARFLVETLNGITRKASASEIISTPQAAFSGNGMITGQVSQLVPRLLVKCAPAENYTAENVSAVFTALNLTFFEDSVTSGLYVVQFNSSLATANQTAELLGKALSMCSAPADIFQLGLVKPQNGSTCDKTVTYVYSDRTELGGTGLSGSECRNMTFRKLSTYAQGQGAEGIITALDVNTAINQTVQARITAATRNGFVSSAIAQEG